MITYRDIKPFLAVLVNGGPNLTCHWCHIELNLDTTKGGERLCFDHLDPETKLFNICSSVSGRAARGVPDAFELVMEETAKCVLACMSCNGTRYMAWKGQKYLPRENLFNVVTNKRHVVITSVVFYPEEHDLALRFCQRLNELGLAEELSLARQA